MPAHSDMAGRVILEQAYAASKMLDNSGWNGLLRRRITPSDIDHPPVGLCFDNNGAVLFADFSINCDNWSLLGRTLRGQRWLYNPSSGTAPIARSFASTTSRRRWSVISTLCATLIGFRSWFGISSPCCRRSTTALIGRAS